MDRAFDFSKREKAIGGTGNPNDSRITRYARQPSYVSLAHIDGLLVDNVQVLADEKIFAQFPRAAVAVFETERARLQNISRLPAGSAAGEPVLTLENCRDAVVTGCRAEPGTPVFLGVRGARSEEIALSGNFLKHAARPFILAPEVAASAVTAP